MLLVQPDGKLRRRSASSVLKFRSFGLIFPRTCYATKQDVKTPIGIRSDITGPNQRHRTCFRGISNESDSTRRVRPFASAS